MAAFRSKSIVGMSQRTNTTIPAPSGIQDGDSLVILLYIELNAATPPTDFDEFTGLGPLTFPVHTDTTMWAWRKTADSESGDYTITHNNAFANAVMLVYSGGAATIEDVVPSTNSGNADPNMLADSVTVLTPGSILIYVAAMWNVPADRPVMPGGVTPVFVERWNPHDSPTFPEGVFGLLVGDGVVVAGATGDKTATDGPDLDDWVTSLIVIRAEASSGGGALALYEEMMS